MDDMSIQGPKPEAPKQAYEREMKESAELFQQALQSYEKSDNPMQKEEFRKVMAQALQVIKDSITALGKNDLKKREAKLEQDFNTFEEKGDTKPLKNDLKYFSK